MALPPEAAGHAAQSSALGGAAHKGGERRESVVVDQLDERALAGEWRRRAQLPADERGEDLSMLVGDTVE